MQNEHLDASRHTAAHLLASAILEIYPDAKLGIGPTIDTGFYYDIQFPDGIVFSDADLKVVEKAMKRLISQDLEMTGQTVTAQEARSAMENQPFKLELIDELEQAGQEMSLYTIGNFTDLCRGGHVERSKEIPVDGLKLQSVAGAYWRGNENNAMLTRIYGLLFNTKEELREHIDRIEEAKKRDHRKIGQELDLFTFSPLVGSGLPLFTPRGTILREELIQYSEQLQKSRGFQKVWIPVVAKTDLYKASGHWDKFGDELFLVQSQETSDQFVLKPMNCPHHIQIYASQKRSYRELPIRYYETTTNYRDERAGELLGLSRVRSLTQDDAHIFATMDQIEDEFFNIMEMIRELYSTLDLGFKARLSFSDPNDMSKYLGEQSNWEMAEQIIEAVAKRLELDYEVARGEAAFYGPKIDIMVIDAMGREWQCATQQLDFVQPERFGLKYVAEDGSLKTPVMLHKALLGSVERFMSIYLEHTVGNFPVWLSPVQVQLISVGESHRNYCSELVSWFGNAGVRAVSDDSDESVSKKIRNAVRQKVPYILVIGDKEMQSQALMVRKRGQEDTVAIGREEFLTQLTEKITERSGEL